MAAQSGKNPLTASSPVEAVKGEHASLLLIMKGLRDQPVSGRLLRGLAPYLDEQGAHHVVLLTERRRREPWSDSEDVVVYQEVIHWARGEGGGVYRGATWKGRSLSRDELIPAFQRDPLGVVDWAARRAQAAVISTAEPIGLVPCIVPKPWGRELWYTGIEKRGRASVRSATGETDLPYALGMFPVPIVGEDERPPVLLKALEPAPEAIVGDLYLEVHDKKWEVYVVLDVDRAAWPDGVGRLRAGLAPAAVERYRTQAGGGWEAALSRDLLAALRDYEQVRRRLDALQDAALQQLGLDPAQGIPLDRRDGVVRQMPSALRSEERARREAVEAFLGHLEMPPGAVACLHPGVLHSLQHGVKVIEFQTPTYERLIAMFAQKVLTQAHWDSEQAVARMEKGPFNQPPLQVLERNDGLMVERVVDFPEFEVRRITVPPGATHASVTQGEGAYQLLIGVDGAGEITLPDGRTWALKKEAAYLLPATLGAFAVRALDGAPLQWLVASPHPPARPAYPA